MDKKTIVSTGSKIHGILIAAATVLWAYTFVYNLGSLALSDGIMKVIDIIVTIVYVAVSVWCLIQGTKLSAENKKLSTGEVKGIGAIVPSAIVSIVSGIICFFLGIILSLVVWIVSGIALKNLSKVKDQDDFKDRLLQN